MVSQLPLGCLPHQTSQMGRKATYARGQRSSTQAWCQTMVVVWTNLGAFLHEHCICPGACLLQYTPGVLLCCKLLVESRLRKSSPWMAPLCQLSQALWAVHLVMQSSSSLTEQNQVAVWRLDVTAYVNYGCQSEVTAHNQLVSHSRAAVLPCFHHSCHAASRKSDAAGTCRHAWALHLHGQSIWHMQAVEHVVHGRAMRKIPACVVTPCYHAASK